jgi:DNA-binding transcriptional LysR family regulator
VERINPDPRLLTYFLAVAEELHFGRAAARLHLSQPAVSRGVKNLEAALGVLLFERVGRGVRLTAAGSVLLERAPPAMEALTRALQESRAAGLGRRGHLSVSFLPSARLFVLPAVQKFREEFALVHLALHEGLDQQQFDALHTGRADVGVVRGRRDDQRLEFEPLVDAELCVALPAGHHLADRDELTYADLAAEDFVLWPREDSPDGFDHVLAGCSRAGFRPRIAAETSEAQTVAALVAAGVGISILASSLRDIVDQEVVFVTLHDEHDRLYLVWHSGDESPVRRDFVRILKERNPAGLLSASSNAS